MRATTKTTISSLALALGLSACAHMPWSDLVPAPCARFSEPVHFICQAGGRKVSEGYATEMCHYNEPPRWEIQVGPNIRRLAVGVQCFAIADGHKDGTPDALPLPRSE